MIPTRRKSNPPAKCLVTFAYLNTQLSLPFQSPVSSHIVITVTRASASLEEASSTQKHCSLLVHIQKPTKHFHFKPQCLCSTVSELSSQKAETVLGTYN